jgi:hypothetical protein
VSPVKYELGFYIPEDGILHKECVCRIRKNFKQNILGEISYFLSGDEKSYKNHRTDILGHEDTEYQTRRRLRTDSLLQLVPLPWESCKKMKHGGCLGLNCYGKQLRQENCTEARTWRINQKMPAHVLHTQ